MSKVTVVGAGNVGVLLAQMFLPSMKWQTKL